MFFEKYNNQRLVEDGHTGYSVPYLVHLQKTHSGQFVEKYVVARQHPDGYLYQETPKIDKYTGKYVSITEYSWVIEDVAKITLEDECENIKGSLCEKISCVSDVDEKSPKGANACKSCQKKTSQSYGGVCPVAQMPKLLKQERVTARIDGNIFYSWKGNLNAKEKHAEAIKKIIYSVIGLNYHTTINSFDIGDYTTGHAVIIVEIHSLATHYLKDIRGRDEGIYQDGEEFTRELFLKEVLTW